MLIVGKNVLRELAKKNEVFDVQCTFQTRSPNCEKRLLAPCYVIRMEQLGYRWTDFDETGYLGFFFRKSLRVLLSINVTDL
jgi:hypothetical protein